MTRGRTTATRGTRASRARTLRRLLALCLGAALLLAACTSQAEKNPEEPSVSRFHAWLDAFNSGDRERFTTFVLDSFLFPATVVNVEQEMFFREVTGGFDLRELERATATEVVGLLEERHSDQFARFVLQVEAEEPHRIVGVDLTAIERPAAYSIGRLTEDEVIADLVAFVRAEAAADRFSGAVLVTKDGDVLFSRAYGLADREREITNTLDKRFRIGSMNKMFTAVAILQLVKAGKVELSAPLGTYLTDYPNRRIAEQVTIHHLLTHTGGTGDIFGPEFEANRSKLRTLADYVELYGRRGPEFDPGSDWVYSNYGFLLLGVVVEEVTGQSYYGYVRTHIFEPAGMTGTGSLPEGRAVPDRSIGYMRDPLTSEWIPNADTLPYRGTSAGGGYSTVGDLGRFAEALMRNELLDADSTELLITGKVESGPGAEYAYGFEDHRDADGVRSVGHGGGAPGMNGTLRIYPESGYVVAVLSNLDPPAAQRIADHLDPRLPLV